MTGLRVHFVQGGASGVEKALAERSGNLRVDADPFKEAATVLPVCLYTCVCASFDCGA